MLILRLSKFKSTQTGYDIVVSRKKAGLRKKAIDKIGYIINVPGTSNKFVVINKKKLALWVARGVLLSNRLVRLLVKDGK